jgi:aspartyl-tRNA synthetase
MVHPHRRQREGARPTLVNPKIPTGEIEVFIRDMEVLGAAEELPLPVFGDQEYPEETRLRYRFLDLRREKMHANMMLRSDVVPRCAGGCGIIGFREYQTPIITASSPRGRARLSGALAPASGQVLRAAAGAAAVQAADHGVGLRQVFPDRALLPRRRPARRPLAHDFYQLDMEMSFVEQEDVFDTIEPVMKGVFEEFGGGRR